MAKGRERYLSDGLTKAGFTVFHSEANFLLFKDFKTGAGIVAVRVFSGTRDPDPVLQKLQGTRLTRFYRICVRTHEENLEFLEILDK